MPVPQLTLGRHVVDPAGAPRVAAQQPPDGQTGTDHRAVGAQRGHRVGTAGRVVPAGRRRVRGDEALVEADRRDQHLGRERRHRDDLPVGRRRARHADARLRSARREPGSQVPGQFDAAGGRRGRQRPDHHIGAGGQSPPTPAGPAAAAAGSPDAGRRSCRPCRTRRNPARGACCPPGAQQVHHQMTGAGAASGTDHRGEIIRCVQATTSGKHGVRDRADQGRQADSSSRPLRRRAARMARPARVRIRSRNPWVFARRRLFGWKVRLLTAISPLRELLKILERCSGETGDTRRPTEVSLRSNERRRRGSMKRPECAGSLQGTDSRADGSNSPSASPAVSRSDTPIEIPAVGPGLVARTGKLLASRAHGSESPSPPEQLFIAANQAARAVALPLVVHSCGQLLWMARWGGEGQGGNEWLSRIRRTD